MQEALVTKSFAPGESVYNEKRIAAEDQDGNKIEYRVWNPYRSKIVIIISMRLLRVDDDLWAYFLVSHCLYLLILKLKAAAIIGGVEDTHIRPGCKVLYLGGASGTTVSHVSDIVGPEGVVYAVEFSARSGRDLVNMAKKRTNVVPLVADARKPLEYRMLVSMVDVVFADVAQPDQARIIGMNC